MSDTNGEAMTAVKFAKGSDHIIEGLAIPYGGPFGGKDLDGEFFTKSTDFCLDWFPVRPVIYDHGLDDAVKTSVVGRVTEHEDTEDGLWAQVQLDKNSRYLTAIQGLVKKGALSFSSGAMPHVVRKDKKSGEIVRWPWVELSLTPTPANPDAVVYAVKSGHDLIDHLEQVTDVPAPIAAAIKALDDWTDHNDTTDGLGNEPYSEHGRRVYADLSDFVARSQLKYDARIKAGRELSSDNWKLLRELRDMAARLDELLQRNDPSPQPENSKSGDGWRLAAKAHLALMATQAPYIKEHN